MPYDETTSVNERTRYRLERAWHALRRLISPIQPPSPAVDSHVPAVPEKVGDPETFADDSFGSGPFGKWILDADHLPAYHYELNQYEDERARYPVSEGAFRCDHWHQVGNERLNALASNEGTVQVLVADGGGMFLNQFSYGQQMSGLGVGWEIAKIVLKGIFYIIRRFFGSGRDPGFKDSLNTARSVPGAYHRDDVQHGYAGGFAYLDDGQEVWSTAYRYSPSLREKMQRVFGMGYYQTVADYRNVCVTRRVYAPAGDVPALLVDVELKNTSGAPISLTYYEYWDVNVQQLPFQALRSGTFGLIGDVERRKLNKQFSTCILWINNARALRLHLQPRRAVKHSSPDTPDVVNRRPRDIFLADLSGGAAPEWYFDKSRFFGSGGAQKPFGVGKSSETRTSDVSNINMPYCMVLRRQMSIPAQGSVRLRFAYGTVEPDDALDCSRPVQPVEMPEDWKQLFQVKYRLTNAAFDPFQDMIAYWKSRLAYFTIGSAPYLQREMAWHAYYLQSSTVYHDYFKNRFVPQGSAYLYLQGVDGVPRDFSLFALPLVYLNPGLARDVLQCVMKMTHWDTGQMAYSYTGNGILTGVLVHTSPSDLDLFFLLALTEYVAATGDADFLKHPVDFYRGDKKRPQKAIVLDHVRRAFDHLMHDIGIGESNLIRVCDGDWSDDVVLKNTFPIDLLSFNSRTKTFARGESVMNSQMAVYILPRIANLMSSLESPEARQLGEAMQAELKTALPRLKKGIRAQWQGQFFARAVLRTFWGSEHVLHADKLDLEGQVWAFIGDLELKDGLLDTLKNSVYTTCDERSPIGALMASGQVWPAITQLLTWGYTHRYPDLAWRSFVNHTFANKANVYGDLWINIWSGPDGVNVTGGGEPGGTYEAFPATPTIDFPVMNNNQHAMALLALIRVCGIEPTEAGDGLRITPQVPKRYSLKLPLLTLDVSPERISGEYHPQNAGKRALYIRLPSTPPKVEALVNGSPVPVEPDSQGYVKLSLPEFAAGGSGIPFEVRAG